VVIYPLVRRAFPSLILLIAISGGSLFFCLGSLPLCGADEPRYARIAQEMREQGSWITPLLEGKPWLEKPPLYYWITAPLYSVFSIKETAARFGSSICALISAIAVFQLGSVLWSRIAGLAGASILLTSLGFVGFGRSASTDMPYTCFLTLAISLLAAAVRRDTGWKILFAYVFLGLSVLGKGPVAVLLAIGIGLCFWFLDECGVALRNWRIMPGIVIAAAVSLPWFWLAFRQNGFAFISTFFINHNLARYITGIHHHSQPTLYYLPILLGLFFPWSGWFTLLFSKSPLQGFRRRREWDPAMVFLVCWAIFPLIFFSISDSKLPGYILPSLPPLALILGVRISRAFDGLREPAARSRLRAVAGLHLALSATIAVAVTVFFQREYGGNWRTGLILAAAILVPALFSFGFGLMGKCVQAFSATVLQGLIIIVALTQFAFPVLGAYHSTREIAQRALDLRQSGEPIITYRFFHHSLNYYTGYQIAGKMDDVPSLARFAREHPASLVITDVRGMQDISGAREFLISSLAEQGDFRLMSLSLRVFESGVKLEDSKAQRNAGR
jgi:4-amino-4-deoxy-L-arabinose transferase-like glycosyltransferase